MSTEEHKTTLKEYGAAIIAGSRPETLDVPVFELDSKDFLSLLDNINSQNDEELKTGFYYSLRRQLEKNFQKYDENTQSQIKSTLLSTISFALFQKDSSEMFVSIGLISLPKKNFVRSRILF